MAELYIPWMSQQAAPHMNLVISGAYGISIPEAEAYKRNEANKRDVYATIRPVVEKWQLFLSVRYMRAAMKKERL